ncbi:MAG: serine hydrolase, partial [Planctomycetota bacterium]
PGASFAIVLDGKLEYVGGTGLRDIKNELPATEDTLFAIGSCTKAMTGIIAAKLVEEERIAWDEPLASSALPSLKFRDPYLTAHATLRDLMAHRTGVGSYNMLWYGAPRKTPELVEALPHLHSYFSFRRQYAYNNLLYSVAGHALSEVAGKSWNELITEHVLTPLGMEHSVTTYEGFIGHPERSTGYDFDGVTPLPHLNIDSVGPAGGVGSTARDMAQWLLAVVHEGEHGDSGLLSAGAFTDLTSPHIIIDGSEQAYYGVGWEVAWKNGLRTIGHGGGIVGQNAYVRAVPDRGFGIVILANQQSDFDDLLVRYAEDHFVHGGLERDAEWEARLTATIERKERTRQQSHAIAPTVETNPEAPHALELAHYAGVYVHPAFSPITITHPGEGLLVFDFNQFEGPVKHWENEHFLGLADPDNVGFQFDLRFQVNDDGEVTGLAAGLERGLPDIPMTRTEVPASQETQGGR